VEELLRRAALATASAEWSLRDLHVILDAVPTPISWATLSDGRIRFANRSFIRTFGYAEAELTTIERWVADSYPRPEDRERALGLWESLWNSARTGMAEVPAIEIEVRCSDGRILTVQHRGILLPQIDLGVATFEDITAQKQAAEALRRLAFEDPLTGLPNRRALQGHWQQLGQARAGEQMIAFLLIDLDGFKAVNDGLGHDAGDELLQGAADRLRRCVRDADVVCRMGGDEFAILLCHPVSQAVAEQVFAQIKAAFQAPFNIQGKQVWVGASMGASLYPEQAADLAELMRRADEALYRVKRAGKGDWQWAEVT
jgi:diguanylate cyclase (GGDEF)-like protein/PAS domain S-box-containing protein